MKRLADRRGILLGAATAAVAFGALANSPHSSEIAITIGFEGGEAIPKGRLAVYLEGPADPQRMAARASAESDGGSSRIRLALPLPPGTRMSSRQQVVAELQRADGWLLARGSAQVEDGLPVEITLYTVMY